MKEHKKNIISLERAFSIIKAPKVTEKSTTVSQYGQYCFLTAKDATKREIKEAIEQIFKVKVKSVNTLIQLGKRKRFRGVLGKRPDFKKAYVNLEQGHTIDIGAGL